MAKLRYINEVVALRGVFFKLFETKQREQENVGEKVLIRVNLLENQYNPFLDYEEDEMMNHLDDSNANMFFASRDSHFDNLRR